MSSTHALGLGDRKYQTKKVRSEHGSWWSQCVVQHPPYGHFVTCSWLVRGLNYSDGTSPEPHPPWNEEEYISQTFSASALTLISLLIPCIYWMYIFPYNPIHFSFWDIVMICSLGIFDNKKCIVQFVKRTVTFVYFQSSCNTKVEMIILFYNCLCYKYCTCAWE